MRLMPAELRRHFLSWERPWLPQVVGWLAAGWRGVGPLDLSRTLVVVPTRQSGRRLRAALAEYAAAKNTAVFAPRVVTPDALVSGEAAADVASRLQALVAWTVVLRGIDLGEFRHVFPVDPPARHFPWALRLAQAFTRLQATLAEAALTLPDVPGRLGENFIEAARWAEMAELGARQERELARHGWQEPQRARVAGVGRPAAEEFGRIALLAVPDLPPLGLERLTALAAGRAIDVVIFAPAADAAHFDDWGRPLASSWEQRILVLPDFERRVHLCADAGAQAARALKWAANYAAGSPGFAVGVADPEVAPLLERELKRAGRAAFNPEGRARRHEAFHALLTALAGLARDPSFAAIEALARCPDFFAYLQSRRGGDFSVARWLAGLDELRARHLPADLTAAIAFAPRIASGAELAAGLAAMDTLHTQLNTGPFANAVLGALREIYGARRLDLGRERDLQFQEAAAGWTALVQQCAAAEERFGGLSAADCWDLALQLFGEQRDTAEKPAHAVALQGWLELLWEDAPHLAVTGFNDGRVPEAIAEDAFMPESLRQRLGLPTNATRFARDAYLLQAIAACRERHGRLDLVFGKVSAAGEPLRPSRLLLRCADEELPTRVQFLFRPVESAEASFPWTRAWKLRPRAAPPPERVAVTALRRYLECPFRFYLRSVLKMEPVDPLKSELDAFDFGTLCHAALERIGLEDEMRDCTDAGLLRTALLAQLDRAVRERYGKFLSLPLVVQVESARQRLGRLAELQAAERAAGWQILHVERSFEVVVSGLIVRGKIDRIDRHLETGAIRVLDYKTSDRPVTPAVAHLRRLRPGDDTPAWARVEAGNGPAAWADLQLPMYLRAMAVEYPGRVGCGYFNLPKAAGETTLALWQDYTPELHASAMHCAEQACAAIRRGDFWPPNDTLRAERDECAALFHHSVADSIEWRTR